MQESTTSFVDLPGLGEWR